MSFQKFVQLDAHETVPDESTICRFRQRLIDLRSARATAGSANTQLGSPRLHRQTHHHGRRDLIPIQPQTARRASRPHLAPDADARYTRKYSQSYYGYKAHVSSDGEHQLVRTAHISAPRQRRRFAPRVVPADAGSL
ncbi:MAG: transposase [Verrucomicrobia bacterium]|nr:transposase [Verrucomicrobiota bacterium]